MDNQKNLLLAVVFSLVILIAFDFFFGPKSLTEKNMESGTDSQIIDPDTPTIDNSLVQKPKTTSLNEKRITFKADRIEGSINLYGATLDDLVLSDYFETIKKEKKSKFCTKKVRLHLYFLRMGWASTDKNVELPDKILYGNRAKIILIKKVSSWSGKTKNGLFIKRNISFDKNFMITITDEIINKTKKTIELTNFSYLRRKNYLPENKFFILHEGPLGVFNDTLKEISYDDLEENEEIIESTKNGWIGYTDHYWQIAIFPDTNESFKARFKSLKNQKTQFK